MDTWIEAYSSSWPIREPGVDRSDLLTVGYKNRRGRQLVPKTDILDFASAVNTQTLLDAVLRPNRGATRCHAKPADVWWKQGWKHSCFVLPYLGRAQENRSCFPLRSLGHSKSPKTGQRSQQCDPFTEKKTIEIKCGAERHRRAGTAKASERLQALFVWKQNEVKLGKLYYFAEKTSKTRRYLINLASMARDVGGIKGGRANSTPGLLPEQRRLS